MVPLWVGWFRDWDEIHDPIGVIDRGHRAAQVGVERCSSGDGPAGEVVSVEDLLYESACGGFVGAQRPESGVEFGGDLGAVQVWFGRCVVALQLQCVADTRAARHDDHQAGSVDAGGQIRVAGCAVLAIGPWQGWPLGRGPTDSERNPEIWEKSAASYSDQGPPSFP